MQSPSSPDVLVTQAMMDLATRPWNHVADAMQAALQVLLDRRIPLARFEMQVGLIHPLLTGLRLVWTVDGGFTYVVEVGGQLIVESPQERTFAANPLTYREPVYSEERWVLEQIPVDLARRLADARVLLPALLAFEEGPVAGILLGAIEHDGAQRPRVLFMPLRGHRFTAVEACAIHTLTWSAAALLRPVRWRVLAQVLAKTYLGARTGLRVLHGELRRGSVERRTAVIWFSSVRGYAALSLRLEPEQVVAVLNAMFDLVGKHITAQDGELLKIAGDTVLAIFPYGIEPTARDASRRAVQAVRGVLDELPGGVELGVGLHHGEVAYGNIGSTERLDFTVVGAAVNLAYRLERHASRLDVPVLGSAEVVDLEPTVWEHAGRLQVGSEGEEVDCYWLA